jgi:parvulin-like peptidyl-prolyl isomerase
MRALRIALPFVLLLALATAGCGGGSKTKVPADAVAVVGDRTIPKTAYDAFIVRAKRGYKQQKRAFPKAGTPQFQQLQQQAVNFLVQVEELEQKAKELGVTITEKQITDRFAQIRRQLGGQKNLEAQAKANGLTLDDVRAVVIRPQLLSEGISKKLTGDVKVSDKDVENYYKSHLKLYQQPESRDVRHILVSNRALANKLYDRIKAGADMAKLARKYSKDPGSRAQGGKLTVVKGTTAAAFDQTVFLLDKGKLSRPVKTQFGWHVIEAISGVRPARTTPLKDVKTAIRQQLLSQRRNEKLQKWAKDTKAEFAKKVHYQVGYAPQSTSTSGK